MTQTSYTIDYTPSGAAVGQRLDEVHNALRSSNLGTTAPVDPLPGQIWADSSVSGQIAVKMFDAVGWRLLYTVSTGTGAVTLSNIATKAEAEAGSLVDKIITALRVQEWGNANALLQGTHSMPVGAASFAPQSANGSGTLETRESALNNVFVEYLPFDPASDQYAQFWFRAPKSVDETETFQGSISWQEATGATAHGVAWRVEMHAQGDGDAVDSAWGTAVIVTDVGTSGTRHEVSFVGLEPPNGWAKGDWLGVRVSRVTGDVNDTLDVNAEFIGLTLDLPINAKDDT